MRPGRSSRAGFVRGIEESRVRSPAAGGAPASCRHKIADGNPLKDNADEGQGATTRALGFVRRVLGSFVAILGSFVGFLGFGGFVRGFVRRKKAEMCRYTLHKQR
jgi:hypothetical protein